MSLVQLFCAFAAACTSPFWCWKLNCPKAGIDRIGGVQRISKYQLLAARGRSSGIRFRFRA